MMAIEKVHYAKSKVTVIQFRAIAIIFILEIGIVTIGSFANENQVTSQLNLQLCPCEMKTCATLCRITFLPWEETLCPRSGKYRTCNFWKIEITDTMVIL